MNMSRAPANPTRWAGDVKWDAVHEYLKNKPIGTKIRRFATPVLNDADQTISFQDRKQYKISSNKTSQTFSLDDIKGKTIGSVTELEMQTIRANIDSGLSVNERDSIAQRAMFQEIFGADACKYSIIKMTEKNDETKTMEDVYILKPSKENLVGQGGFAKVKQNPVVYYPNRQGDKRGPFLLEDKVLRSANVYPSLTAQVQLAQEKNLLQEFASAQRDKKKTSPSSNPIQKRHYLLLEKANCNLGQFLADPTKYVSSFTEQDRMDLAIKITQAIYEFHTKHNLAHHDIKPENFLIYIKNGKIDVQLTDFDFIEEDLQASQSITRGTPIYAPGTWNAQQTSFRLSDIAYTGAQLDAFALSKTLLIDYQYRGDMLPSVFSSDHCKTDTPLGALLADGLKDEPSQDAPTVKTMLVGLLLERHDLLKHFVAGGKVNIPDTFADIVLAYHAQNPDCSLLSNDAMKRLIEQYAKNNGSDELRKIKNSFDNAFLEVNIKKQDGNTKPYILTLSTDGNLATLACMNAFLKKKLVSTDAVSIILQPDAVREITQRANDALKAVRENIEKYASKKKNDGDTPDEQGRITKLLETKYAELEAKSASEKNPNDNNQREYLIAQLRSLKALYEVRKDVGAEYKFFWSGATGCLATTKLEAVDIILKGMQSPQHFDWNILNNDPKLKKATTESFSDLAKIVDALKKIIPDSMVAKPLNSNSM